MIVLESYNIRILLPAISDCIQITKLHILLPLYTLFVK